jgi:hypothetical protein
MEVKNTEILTMEIIFASQNPYHIQTTVFQVVVVSGKRQLDIWMNGRQLSDWSSKETATTQRSRSWWGQGGMPLSLFR